jgi:thioredoxin reductase (NADPH)
MPQTSSPGKRKLAMPPINEESASKRQAYDYDFAVIGGGSGGMAAAKKAASYGAKVALFDFVKPSPQGTKWGLGGTCVNVGCVPKKLMHYAGLVGEALHDAQACGWKFNVDASGSNGKPEFDWMSLMANTKAHVKSLNFGYKNGLRSAKVTYINALASFESEHTLVYEDKKAGKQSISAAHILIATGGRPTIPDIPGKEFGITSDDIFYLKKSPGKTLCIGAGYISLECGGFIKALGFETHVAYRSIALRGFDRDCADKIIEVMKANGVKFIEKYVPESITKNDDGKLVVTLAPNGAGEKIVETYDTVLFAIGRSADTGGIGLDKVGVTVNKNGKISSENETTNVAHIHAVGDVLQDRPELTPVAIQAAELLASRLFGGAKRHMDYKMVPTTVFTPSEYGCVGYTEEEAIAKFGADAVDAYLWSWSTLEHQAVHRLKDESVRENIVDTMPPNCLAKLVVTRPTAADPSETVVGFHFVGPNAGEITQGFAIAVKAGATKEMFDEIIGIHPTDAEAFTTMEVKRSEMNDPSDWVASGGCGGGKCG